MTRNLPPGVSQAGALIYARWLTEDAADQGLTSLKTYLRRYGWKPSTVVFLLEPDSSSALHLMAVPFRSPYTKGPNGHGPMQVQLRSLAKCLQRFEIAADRDLLDLHYTLGLELAG